ncbi:MAG: hypothetical protein IKJ76_02880 [Fibrobacter sp.]|nr:hypothetical protein [Fibrobacter sp.]
MKKIITIIAAASIFLLGCGSDSGTNAASAPEQFYYYEHGVLTIDAANTILNCTSATCAFQAVKTYPSDQVLQRTGTRADVDAYAASLNFFEMDKIWNLVDNMGKAFYQFNSTSGYQNYFYVEKK